MGKATKKMGKRKQGIQWKKKIDNGFQMFFFFWFVSESPFLFLIPLFFPFSIWHFSILHPRAFGFRQETLKFNFLEDLFAIFPSFDKIKRRIKVHTHFTWKSSIWWVELAKNICLCTPHTNKKTPSLTYKQLNYIYQLDGYGLKAWRQNQLSIRR